MAQIIAFVDTNSNLALLLPEQNPNWKIELWMAIFSDDKIAGLHAKCVICSASLVVPYPHSFRREEQRVSASAKFVAVATCNFQAGLPFSWLIKETIDGIIQQRAATAGEYEITILLYFDTHLISP